MTNNIPYTGLGLGFKDVALALSGLVDVFKALGLASCSVALLTSLTFCHSLIAYAPVFFSLRVKNIPMMLSDVSSTQSKLNKLKINLLNINTSKFIILTSLMCTLFWLIRMNSCVVKQLISSR